MKYRTLPWYGGKSSQSTQTGAWIVDLMGTVEPDTYIEPFAGMCGILLRRPPAGSEIINDLDPVVTNWWLVVRDHVHELIDILYWTPHKSRPLYMDCVDILNQPPCYPEASVLHAWALAVVQANSLMSLSSKHAWGLKVRTSSQLTRVLSERELLALSSRVQNIQIQHGDAVHLLKDSALLSNALIYADPPYLDAYTDPYRSTVSIESLSAALLSQTGKIACSGYPGQMPALEKAGWARHDFKTYIAVASSQDSGSITEQRTECLWMNYEPPQQALFISL